MSVHDRRNRLRFPLKTELKFHVIRRGQGKPITGIGSVTDMSSKGLAFRTDTPLAQGVRLGVSLAWPALLDDRCLLRLNLEGTIVRIQGDLIVLRIESHDFRTSGKLSANSRDEIAAMTRDIDNLFPAARIH